MNTDIKWIAFEVFKFVLGWVALASWCLFIIMAAHKAAHGPEYIDKQCKPISAYNRHDKYSCYYSTR